MQFRCLLDTDKPTEKRQAKYIKYIPTLSIANVTINTIRFNFKPLQFSYNKLVRFLFFFLRLLNLIDHYVDRMQLTYLILGTTRKPIYVFTNSKIKINGTPALKPFPYIRKLTQRKRSQNRRDTGKLSKSIVIIFIMFNL